MAVIFSWPVILPWLICFFSVLILSFWVWRKWGPSNAWKLGFGLFLAGGTIIWVSQNSPFNPTGSGLAGSGLASASDSSEVRFATSEECASCHQEQFDSWKKTFHRTMTRNATPEFVKANFDNATNTYQGIVSRMTREGDSYFMETVDPDWAMRQAQTRTGLAGQTNPPLKKFRVDRVVGSHWLQECIHEKSNGEFQRLPILYHLGEKRWIHSNGSFLAPDTEDFWSQSRGAIWNETCLYCHNTGVQKNPVKSAKGQVIAYKTTVHELGISCEACHGPGGIHVEQQKSLVSSGEFNGPTDVVNPGKLSVARQDDICARCHGALTPKSQMWDHKTHKDPFVPGLDLTTFNHIFWSEKEQHQLVQGKPPQSRLQPEPTDGRFWGDGTPLTTSLEFNAMALSACYEKGQGKMSCLTCHTMHGNDPNYLLKPGMGSNEACFQCHQDYRQKLTDHTRHGAQSEGSQCVSCHMPHQVYSLLNSHISHRITIPDIQSSQGTGKPNACNLCHLDKSLGWTQKELAKWPNGAKHAAGRLSRDEESIASSILSLIQGDARTRTIVASAFTKPAARKASGDDWYGGFLSRLMMMERYPAVRYMAHKSLVGVHGSAQISWDTLARPEQRTQQLKLLIRRFDTRPISGNYPFLPLTPNGQPDETIMKRLALKRWDPDLTVNE